MGDQPIQDTRCNKRDAVENDQVSKEVREVLVVGVLEVVGPDIREALVVKTLGSGKN